MKLFLYIGRGPVELRQKLYNMAHDKKPLKPLDAFRPKWNAIFSRHFMRSDSYEKPQEEVDEELKTHWNQFLATDLQAIIAILEAEHWIFEKASLP